MRSEVAVTTGLFPYVAQIRQYDATQGMHLPRRLRQLLAALEAA